MITRFETFVLSVNRIYRCIQKIKNKEMTEFDLKGTNAMCIITLMKSDEGFTAAELSNICMEDKAAVSRAVSYLEEHGLVSFDDCGKKRRYRSKVMLTDDGKRVGEQILKVIEKIMAEVGEGLNEEERKIFYKGLSVISEKLTKICDN